MPQQQLFTAVITALLVETLLPQVLGWGVEITCESDDYCQAGENLIINFQFLGLPRPNQQQLNQNGINGNRIVSRLWHMKISSNITTGDNYYFEAYENPGGSGGALGPFSVLGANEPTPSGGSGGGDGSYTSYINPAYTYYPPYIYPSYTYSSYTYRPTSGSDSDSDEYEN
ncbi:hypothetical protein BJV82DRAFT_700359 [Fennellomyces sp. T-0311]|nr:hypothetical protein BJV82DRAFT_700359 [Fennellomyces sp. T-0311]